MSGSCSLCFSYVGFFLVGLCDDIIHFLLDIRSDFFIQQRSIYSNPIVCGGPIMVSMIARGSKDEISLLVGVGVEVGSLSTFMIGSGTKGPI